MNFVVSKLLTIYSISNEEISQYLNFKSSIIDQMARKYSLSPHALGDKGSLAIVALLLKGSISAGRSATLAEISASMERSGLATARRVRAMIEWLEHCGALERVQIGQDRRRRPFRVTGWLLHALHELAWLVALAGAANAMDWLAEEVRGTDRFLLAMAAPLFEFIQKGALLPDTINLFVDYRAGYALLVHLMGAASLREDGTVLTQVSRKALARTVHVSRAQITGIIARAERLGLVTRLAGERILLDRGFHEDCLSFFRLQMTGLRSALIASWLDEDEEAP